MLLIPTEDRFSWRQPPLLTLLLIFSCVLIYFNSSPDSAALRWGLSWAQLNWVRPFSYQFIHAGEAHLFGNMLFLLLFGVALERQLGAVRLLGLYLWCGLVSGMGYAFLNADSELPLVGASGAIAGLMGLYLGVYGWQRREYLLLLGPLMASFRAPAWILLPLWLGNELLQARLSDDNVAYMAHAIGLLCGCVSLIMLKWAGALPVVSFSGLAEETELHRAPVPARAEALVEALRYEEALVICRSRLQHAGASAELWQFCLNQLRHCNRPTQLQWLEWGCIALQQQQLTAITLLDSLTALNLSDDERACALPAYSQLQLISALILANRSEEACLWLEALKRSPLWRADVRQQARVLLQPLLFNAAPTDTALWRMQTSLAGSPS